MFNDNNESGGANSGRFWRRVRSRLAGRLEDMDDPEVLLARAQREMTEMHARNRERAVEAITHKNNLQQMVADTERHIGKLQAQAEDAAQGGFTAEAATLRREIAECEEALQIRREHLKAATEASESVKAAIKREEERIRQKTAEALSLKAQWKTSQVERTLLSALVDANIGEGGDLSDADLADRHERNRRQVYEALVQKNHLEEMLNGTTRRLETLGRKADLARKRGDEELERQLLREAEQYEANLEGTRTAYEQAVSVTERAVALLRDEEELLRVRGLDPHAAAENMELNIDADRAAYDPAMRPVFLALFAIGLLLIIGALVLIALFS